VHPLGSERINCLVNFRKRLDAFRQDRTNVQCAVSARTGAGLGDGLVTAVVTTIVNGRVLMRDRQVRTLNRTTVIADANRLAQRVKDADLVLFDLDTVKPCPLEWVNDLPGGKPRLIERAEGISYTLVGGEVFFAHGEHQGVYPGQVMRSFAA